MHQNTCSRFLLGVLPNSKVPNNLLQSDFNVKHGIYMLCCFLLTSICLYLSWILRGIRFVDVSNLPHTPIFKSLAFLQVREALQVPNESNLVLFGMLLTFFAMVFSWINVGQTWKTHHANQGKTQLLQLRKAMLLRNAKTI